MTAVWIAVLLLSAALMGWATATELRTSKPTERIPSSSWRPPRGRPIGMRWLGVAGSGGIVLAGLIVASDHWAVALALVAVGVALAVLIQTVLLRRHNQRLARRS